MHSSIFRAVLPLSVLLAALHALPAAAQESSTMQGISGMSGMDMSGMGHASMSMQGPMEAMPGMKATGHGRMQAEKTNAPAPGDCRAMPGMAMARGQSGSGCAAQGTVAPDPLAMPEAVRER